MLFYETDITEFLEQDVLEPLVGDKLHPGVEDGEHVVGVLVAGVPGGGGGEGGGPGLQEGLHLPQVLALLQQRDRVVLAPDPGGTLSLSDMNYAPKFSLLLSS